MCSESEARRIIGPDGAEQLVDIVIGGWDQYRADGRPRRSTPRANVVWDNMMDLAESSFAARDDVEVVPNHQSQGFILKGRLLLRFKKIDRNWRPRNVQTKTQIRLAETGHFDGMPEDLVALTCGYQLDPTESEIQHVRVLRMVKNSLEWSIDLKELAAGVLAPAAPIFGDPGTGTVLPKLPSIRPPRRIKEGEQGQ